MCSLPPRRRLLLLLTAFAMPVAASSAGAQGGDQLRTAEAALVRQDNSDCGNSDVKADDPSRVGGSVLITRQTDGKMRVKVAITAAPDTTYHFFLKCVRSLGDLKTEDEGEATAEFEFAADGAPPILAFDMYPEGAPVGQKFQSTPVKLP